MFDVAVNLGGSDMRSQRRGQGGYNAARGAGRFLAVCGVCSLIVASLIGFLADDASAHTPHDVIEAVVVSPKFAQDHTVYAISRTLLLKSTDGGSTWTKLEMGVDPKGPLVALGISAQDPATVYAAGYGGSGVYASHDAGATWSNVSGNLRGRSISTLAVSPWSDQLVFATGPNGSPLWVTSTGGATWIQVNALQQTTAVAFAPDVDGLVLAGDASGTVHRSEDRGATWSNLPFKADNGGGIRSIAISPRFSSDHTFFVGTESAGVYRTTDGGSSFTRVDGGLDDPKTISLALSPSFGTDGTLWVSTYTDGAFVSTDRGANWSARRDGLTTNEQADLLHRSQFYDLRVAGNRGGEHATLFLGGFDGLFRSRDGGQTWAEVQTQPASIIMGVAVSPAYAKDRTLFLTTYINGLFRSQDDGRHWRVINSGAVSYFDWTRSRFYVNRLFPITVSPNFARDRTVFAVARGEIFRSDDAGSHWKAIIPAGALVKGEFPPDYFFLGMSPNFEHDGTILVGTDGGKVFVSKNRGRSYTRLRDLGQPVTSLVMSPNFAEDGSAFAGTPGGVFRTADTGTSWTATAWPAAARAETSLAISPQFGTDRTLFAGSLSGLYTTTDAGATWTRASAPGALATGAIASVAVSPDFARDGTVLVSVEGRGLYRSTDRGATWAPAGADLLRKGLVLSNFYHATSEPIVFSPNYAEDHTVFGFDETTLVRSTDGGSTWSEVHRPVTEHDTSRDSAPAGQEETPRFGSASSASSASSGSQASASTDVTGRKVVFAAACGAIAVLVLWVAEKAAPRWRWAIRVVAAVAVFGGVLWLLTRR
jgi:photosystem II stability/assembly factor-like uncharacterized protein